ncbi:MAG TPA: 50S ribosomal protein L4 [Candidatus Eremiobacteraceae bacterium]|nr:50S ribosomal protein L4 [Candidatus Eremiobacteraceae bacterium]
MAITIIDKTGKALGTADLPAALSAAPKSALLHQAVVRHLANRRAGTADTKRRDDVAGGGKKPWRQKGTGRARAGSIRSPLWRKGGVVFGPHPRSFAIAMPRTARRRALAMAFAAKAASGEVILVDAAGLKPEKTKDLIALLWGAGRRKPDERAKPDGSSVLFVIDRARDEGAREIALCGRNIAKATVIGHGDVSAHALLAHQRVFVTKNACEKLAEVCGA